MPDQNDRVVTSDLCLANAMLVLEDRLDPETAVAALLKHRPMMWPSALLTGHYDRALGLDGSLIEAVRRYRRAAFDAEWGED